ncbi:hypothetical protein ACHQM5_020364 [Ranunculus cassubicifolius]
MPPKRGTKVTSSVVRTTRKVVEETVNVVVENEKGAENDETETQEIALTTKDPVVTKNIIIEEKTPSTADQQEPKKGSGKPLKLEAPQPKEKSQKKKKMAEKVGKQKKTTTSTPTKEGKEEGEKKVRRKKRFGSGGESYKRYVYRVLKQVHPDLGISSRAMSVLDGLMNDMFERLAKEAAKLGDYTKRMTMSSREIQGAVKLVLPGELGKHAVAEGTKAVSTYVNYGS